MKILSNKAYNELLETIKRLNNDKSELLNKIEILLRDVESKKTSCKMNKGSEFCFNCKNSYRYKTYWGVTEYEKAGCLLDVACEDFERKEVE